MEKHTKLGDDSRTVRSTRFFHKRKKKVFYVDWKENSEGEFLKVTEVCEGKRDTIVVPDELVETFVYSIARVKGPPRREVNNGR